MKGLFTSLAVAASVVFAGANAQAAMLITGSQGITDLSAFTGNDSHLATDTVFKELHFFTTGGQSGDFDTWVTNPEFLNTLDLDITKPSEFSFGSDAFGTFQASSISGGVFIPSGGNSGGSRAFTLNGTFTPGTLFPLDLLPNTAQLVLSFTQSGGQGFPYSLSATLTTPIPDAPEPATIVMLGTIVGPLGLGLLRRRRQKQLAS